MDDIAIKVNRVSKTFKIPHEKNSTLKQAALGVFRSKTYEEFNALKKISFDVKKGEFFGIIGRNGGGKSTILKMLAGIYVPDSGQIKVSGKLSPFLELGVGFNPELTARDNIFLGGVILGLTKKEVREKFDKIVEFSELREFIDMKLKNFSSGMQVRLAFSLAINVHAEILLMDEVLAVGDENFQKKCLEEFKKYKEDGKTVVLVSHDIGVIEKYCDRAMLLRNGEIQKIGKANDVVKEYQIQNTLDNLEEGDEISEPNTKEVKAKIAEVTNVEFFNDKGSKVSEINTGDNINIRVHFKLNQAIENLNFGLAIFSDNEEYYYGINSITDKINVKKYLDKNYFDVKFLSLPFNSSNYYVKVGIFGENDKIVYDFIDSLNTFKVKSLKQNAGLIDISYEWE